MTAGPARRPGRRRARGWIGYLALAAVVIAAVTGLVVRPDDRGGTPAAPQVIVAGAVGLRWDDVDPVETPSLWRLAESGAIGSLSARSARRPTCAADGWVTLGAGNWAAGTAGRGDGGCQPLRVPVEMTAEAGAVLPEHGALVRYNQWELPWGAVPGALAGSVGCTVAVGQGAALAAARSYGRISHYQPSLPSAPRAAARLLGEHCELAIVDLGTITGTGATRQADVRRLDAALARILAARPPEALLLVLGVADPDPDRHLHVAVAHGPQLPPGWLTSATTGRTGYLQLIDVAPTVLAAVDRPAPEELLAGHPVTSRRGRPGDLADAVAALVAANDDVGLTRPVSSWFLVGLTLAQLGLFAAVVPLLRRLGTAGPGPPARWWRRLAPVLLVAAALVLPLVLAVGGVRWWRVPVAGGAFLFTSLAVVVAGGVLVARTPLFRGTLRLVAPLAGVAAAVVAADLFTGSWLQLHGVVGYSAPDGGRHSGLSDLGLGVLMVGTLLVAGCVAELLPRRWRPLAVSMVGAAGVVVVGSPYLGAEMGGAVALASGVCVAAALSTGGWLTARRVAWASLVGAAAVAAVAGFDLARPAEHRTGLAGMLSQLAQGTAGFGLQRVSLANAEALTSSPLTVLAVGSAGFLWFALLRPWGGLRRLFGVHPALRAAVVGASTAALIGGILVGAALTVLGAAAAVGVPLLTLAALRMRHRAAARSARQRVTTG